MTAGRHHDIIGAVMNERGERSRTPEQKVFGRYETVELPVQGYVRLPQVRSAMNPELPNLKDSIRTRGLINPIDVARMSPGQLDTYISFVNRTWKTSVELDDYALQQQPDGWYYVVVAGHTRTEAVAQLEAEAETGYDYILTAKVHEITAPEEIIALQLDENLHSKPAQEQRAIAVVETYQYGLDQGMWASKEEFLRQAQGKFSRQVLNDALGFAQLPPEARDFVFSGKLSYNAAVAIGRASETVLDYVATRAGYDAVPQGTDDAFDEAYRTEVALLIADVLNRSLNGTAAKKYIEGQAGLMRQRVAARQHGEDDEVLFEMVSPTAQREEYLRTLQASYRAAVRTMEGTSIEAVMQVQRLMTQLTGEVTPALEAERRQRVKKFAAPALHATTTPPLVS